MENVGRTCESDDETNIKRISDVGSAIGYDLASFS
jgi:hypothetical protein